MSGLRKRAKSGNKRSSSNRNRGTAKPSVLNNSTNKDSHQPPAGREEVDVPASSEVIFCQ